MKRKKLLNKLADLLDMKGRKQRKHRDELNVLLIKLKKKKVDLKQELRQETDGHRQKRLEKELDIVEAQYVKGLEALQDLKTL
ncbi:MAG: hypothetical protein WBO34_03335 [Gammaproteobacteria bacterium]